LRFESQFSRMNSQIFSTGFSSGHLDGSGTRVMFGGTTRRCERCHPAWSRRSTACAPGATALAIAYGNCVVFKPADLVPGCAWALADIIVRSGIPPGVFNLVMGKGSVVGEILSTNPGIDAVTFTGSVSTGKRVAQNCAARLAKVQL